jgi:N-acetylneuraminic acid mutarotase
LKKLLALVVAVIIFLTVSCNLHVLQVESATNLTDNTWQKMAPMPTARTGFEVGVVNGKIYAIGGQVLSGATGVNEMYDPATNTWTTKAPMPQAGSPSVNSGDGAAVYGGKIYCFSNGLNQVYDPATDSWDSKTPCPICSNYEWTSASACVVNDKIYVLGGFNTVSIVQWSISDLTEMYDPVNDSWTSMAAMPVAMCNSVSTVLENKIYLTGSGDTVQIYDPQTNMWSLGPNLPYSTSYEAGAATSGIYAPERVYIIGGLAYFNDGYVGASCCQIFDLKTGKWSVGSALMPTPRIYFSIAVVDDIIYAIGGEDQNNHGFVTNVNERYIPLGYSSTPSPTHTNSAQPSFSINPTNTATRTLSLNDFTVQSNSTVTDLVFDNQKQELSFNVTGPSGTSGYVNVTVAKSFLASVDNLKVYVDGTQVTSNVSSNETSYFMDFNYTHSTHQVKIDFASESTSFLGFSLAGWVVAIVLVAAMLAVLVMLFFRKKQKQVKPESSAN